MKYRDLGVIVVAGGTSTRYGKNKLLEMLGDAPVLIHSLRNYAPVAGQLILVAAKAYQSVYENLVSRYLPDVAVTWAEGGACRAESVRNGIAAAGQEIDYIAIADAARPLGSAAQLMRLYDYAVKNHCGVISGRKIVDTVKKIDANGKIVAHLVREELFRAETPQLFRLRELRAALAGNIDASITDDAEAMRRAGFPVAALEDENINPKVTMPEDLEKLRKLLAP